ncbi:MAG: HEPN domain-containing protein [Candidatus Dojkabacteria bacterium]|nr:HEPN domain-containing protein [Candidatus Dojkabacteria bacterium]
MSHRFLSWIKQAKFDLEAAKISYSNNFYEWTAYQCIQAVEKSLKSVIVQAGLRPPKVHKLAIILSMCNYISPKFSNIRLDFRYLESFTFVSRYPFVIPSKFNETPHELITKQDADALLNITTQILKIVEDFLYSSDENKYIQFQNKNILYSSDNELFSEKEVEDRINNLVDALINIDPSVMVVKKIMVFGSFARNKIQPKTKTMDILIVADTKMNFIQRISFIRNLTKGGVPIIEPLVYTQEELDFLVNEEGEGMLETALEQSIIVYEKAK